MNTTQPIYNQQTIPAMPVAQKPKHLYDHAMFWPALISIVLALTLAIGGIVYQQNSYAVSIGVTKQVANVTISGFGAPTIAQRVVDANQGKLYIMQTQPSTGMFELCNGNIQGISYIVRDYGAYTFTGGLVCSYMQQIYTASLIKNPNNNGGPGDIVFPGQSQTPLPGSSAQKSVQDNPIIVKPNTVQPLRPVVIPTIQLSVQALKNYTTK